MIFTLLRRIRLRIKDVSTISALCQGAEQHALDNGEDKPGAEHFLLAALDLPDGTAKSVFAEFHVDSEAINAAIYKQYNDALTEVGINVDSVKLNESETKLKQRQHILYQGKPSVQTLMQELAALRRQDKDMPLLGAHVLQVLASREVDTVARTLKTLNISKQDMLKVATEELERYRRNPEHV